MYTKTTATAAAPLAAGLMLAAFTGPALAQSKELVIFAAASL